jgi:glycosyltransferase involved in cell wall biosynthesis
VQQALAPGRLYSDRPCRVLPPGVDLETFRPDEGARCRTLERIGWSPSDPVVGFLGRFVPEKGIDLLLAALRALHTEWRALFVGGGPLEARLRAFAIEYPSRVHVETGVAHEEVPAWLNAMSVLCAPSQTTPRWREQFGRMLVEAMACGVPVIASDSGEMPGVVSDAGLIVPERDTARWADEVDRVLRDDVLRRDLANRALQRARARFAWPVIARGHLDFFESLTGNDSMTVPSTR